MNPENNSRLILAKIIDKELRMTFKLSAEEELAKEHMEKREKEEETFHQHGQVYYQLISEERIREIVREEIVKYNDIFMSQTGMSEEK